MAPGQEPELWGRFWALDAPLPIAQNLALDDYQRSLKGHAARWIDALLDSLYRQFESELRKNNAFPIETPKISVTPGAFGSVTLTMKAAARHFESPVEARADWPATYHFAQRTGANQSTARRPRTTHENW